MESSIGWYSLLDDQTRHGSHYYSFYSCWSQLLERGRLSSRVPPGCAPAILAQNFIGWENFLHGRRVSLEWRDVQERYYQLLGMRRTGKRWVSSLLLKLWHVSWTMWDHRNSVLHHNDQHVVLGSLELNSRIGEEYEMGFKEILSSERYIFAASYQEVLAYSVSRKERWLRSVQAARNLAVQRRTNCDPNQSSITAWLGTDAHQITQNPS